MYKTTIMYRLLILGKEQNRLLTTPSIKTPRRLAQIAEQVKILSEIQAATQGEEDAVHGYLQGLYNRIQLQEECETKWEKLTAWKVVSESLVGRELTYDHFSDISERIAEREVKIHKPSVKNLIYKVLNTILNG